VIARFEAERQALALMDHPNIAKVFDAGATETGRPYFVMELVKGIPVTRFCDENHLSTRVRLGLFVQVCQAIQHAHQKGIIHRDIKPSNILLTDHDGVPVPKIIDFGIAKATTDQRLTDKTLFTAFEQFIGTPAYMSPEQAKMSGLDIDTRSDIYSLGVLLYELLTGKTPFDSKALLQLGLDEMRRTIREQEPVRPSTRLSTMLEGELTTTARHRQSDAPKLITLLRGDLDWIVMKALEKDRSRRYETANGLAMDIQRHLNNEPVVARPPSNVYRLQKMVRRNKVVFAGASSVVLALLIGLGVSTWQFIEKNKAYQRVVVAEKAQGLLLQRAEADEQKAKSEAERAEAAFTETRMALASSDFSQGVRLVAEDNGSEALAYLVRSLSANPTNQAVVTRLTTLLSYRSWMVATVSLRHVGWVFGAKFSLDGKKILTGSGDGTARLWDAQTGQPLTEPLKNELGGTALSPDGNRIVTTGRPARVWDVQTSRQLIELKHDDQDYTVQFSPDGKRIVTASSDHTARVWDAETGQPLTKPLEHDDSVTSARFSPDGALILTTSSDQTARLWDAQTGQKLTTVTNSSAVFSAGFSPDGKRIVTGSLDGTAQVWDARSGQPLLSKPLKHDSQVIHALFSPDGKVVLTVSDDHTARLWDAQTGQPIGQALKHRDKVWSAQFSRDGRRIATASDDGTARVWDAQTGQPVTEPMKHGARVFSVEFSPDGRRILTASADNKARVWEAQSGPLLTEPFKHGPRVLSAQFSPDGKRIATASEDKTARVWDAQTGKALTTPLKHGDTVWSVQFSADGKRLLSASSDHTARLWDAQTGQQLVEPLKHDDQVNSAEFSPDGTQAVTASDDGTARVWDARTGQPVTGPLNQGMPVFSAQFSPDGRWIVTASHRYKARDAAKAAQGRREPVGTARVWNAQTGQQLSEFKLAGARLNGARFSPDGKRILTAAGDLPRVWDALTGQVIMPLGTDGASSGQFSPDGNYIVTAAWDDTARLWDARTGQPFAQPLRHLAWVTSVQFSPNNQWIVTASKDKTARVWDRESGQLLAELLKHSGPVLSAGFSPDGRRVLTASAADGTARIWEITPSLARCPEWLLQLAEAVSGQVLNKKGTLEETKLDRAAVLDQIRQKLSAQSDNDDWVIWGRWFLADASTRTISPFSKITTPEYVENRIKENTTESLGEAERLAGRNTELLQRISEARSALEQINKPAGGGSAPKEN